MNTYQKETYVKDNSQEITLQDRKKLQISGVKKIESLNEIEFIVDTNLGILRVNGSELEMQHLDIEKGILWISGLVYSLEYLEDRTKNKNNEGFFKKLFK